MKFSVSSYSFNSLLESGELNQLACIDKAKELGFDAIEFVDILPHDGSSREEYAKKLREECEAQGLEVSNYTFSADFLNGCGCNTEKEIERVCHEIDIAEILGAKSVRHDATWGIPEGTRGYRGFEDVLSVLADACRKVTQYAKAKGIRTMVENHGYFCQDSMRVEKLVNMVADDNFGLLCDMGNFMCADEKSNEAVGRIAPYAFYVHAKDFLFKSGEGQNPGGGFFKTRGGNYLRGTIVGHGVVPIKQCIDILKENGYNGTIAIEFEGLEPNIRALEIGLENLKRYAE